jgi:hypothetical protein
MLSSNRDAKHVIERHFVFRRQMNGLKPKMRLSVAGEKIAYQTLDGFWAGIPDSESYGKGCVASHPSGHFTPQGDTAYILLEIPNIKTKKYDSNDANADKNPSGRTPKKT